MKLGGGKVGSFCTHSCDLAFDAWLQFDLNAYRGSADTPVLSTVVSFVAFFYLAFIHSYLDAEQYQPNGFDWSRSGAFCAKNTPNPVHK